MIRLFKDGDTSAFDDLVRKHQDRIFNLCYWFLGDYQEANDCAQDTFIKIYLNLPTFRFKSTFSTWAHRIAVNTCKNRLKSFQYRFSKKMLRLDNTGSLSGSRGQIADETRSPEVAHQKKERRRLIHSAINALPLEKKTVILLRDIQGLSYEEIVQITGLKPGTLKSKIARARQDLRTILSGEIS
ncbi:MAG: sigma-70 family RNA polymerase sigma factor [Desulfobacterales bacterium]